MHQSSRRLAVLVAVVSLAVVVTGMTKAPAEQVLEPRALAMGSAATALAGGLSGLQSNPATIGMEGYKGLEVGGLVGHDRLNAAFGAYTTPPKGTGGSSAFGLWRIEDDVTGGTTQAVAYATGFPVDQDLSLGLTLRYWRFSGIGSATSKFDGDIGAIYNLNPEVGDRFVGVAIRNVGKPHSFPGARIARRVAIGGAYRSHQGVLFVADYDDVTGDAADAALRLGAETMLTDRIVGRIGFNDWNVTAGVGVRAGKYSVDYGFQKGDNGFDDFHVLGGMFVF